MHTQLSALRNAAFHLLVAVFASSAAVSAAAAPPLLTLSPGQTVHSAVAGDAPLSKNAMRDRVVVLFVWSTNCAVCRSALPELRANAAGWSGKPFSLYLLNVDSEKAQWQAYEDLVTRTAKPSGNLQSLWLGPLTAPLRLPLTMVVDSQGRVQSRFEGRMAPQAWDTVAELLL